MRAEPRQPGQEGGSSSGWKGPLPSEEVSERYCGGDKAYLEPHLSQLCERAWRRHVFAGDGTLLLLVRAVTLQTRTVSNNAFAAAQRQERVGPG